MNVTVELDYFFDGPAFLEFGDCFFLPGRMSTSTARMTAEELTSPTEHSPFLTASMAY